MKKNQHKRIIFGLKVKQLRQAKNMSFAELSKASALSISYLNEIEKGKKYPKADKISALADALDTSVQQLTSLELSQHLSPVGELLNSNFLNDLPLEKFGLELPKIAEIIANAPVKVGAFIATLVELARNYNLRDEHFYYGALKAFQEINFNYFENLETEVYNFYEAFDIPKKEHLEVNQLYSILKHKFNYSFDHSSLVDYPELRGLRAVFIPKKRKLLIHPDLNEHQIAFVLGREIAFNYLGIDERSYAHPLKTHENFEIVLDNFHASYFAVALLIREDILIQDVKNIFNQDKWNAESFLETMQKYNASPEMFLHRLTNIIPKHFGLNQLFFLRFNTEPSSNHYTLTKELHLNRQHHPHGNGLNEHYCRRWITIWLLENLEKLQQHSDYNAPIIGVQKSRYFGTTDEYLCITLARPAHPTPNNNVSVTIGLLVNDDSRKVIRFLNDENITQKEVNKTCERCAVTNCSVRVEAPIHVKRTQRKRAMKAKLNDLTK